ncbi:hypothetical protein GCM10010451_48150 [Streptomyces virens]|uniref:Uncharacterized protein n=1 Tax=Streptomyces virens TaxID=285572 RepID=A0ABP6PVC0_9ACTN
MRCGPQHAGRDDAVPAAAKRSGSHAQSGWHADEVLVLHGTLLPRYRLLSEATARRHDAGRKASLANSSAVPSRWFNGRRVARFPRAFGDGMEEEDALDLTWDQAVWEVARTANGGGGTAPV